MWSMCLYKWMPMPQKVRNITFPGAGVAGCCEPPDMGTGNLSQALCRSSVCSQLLNHLSSPTTSFIIRKFKHTKTQRKEAQDGLQSSISQGKTARKNWVLLTLISSITGKWNSVFNASPNLWHSALTALQTSIVLKVTRACSVPQSPVAIVSSSIALPRHF